MQNLTVTDRALPLLAAIMTTSSQTNLSEHQPVIDPMDAYEVMFLRGAKPNEWTPSHLLFRDKSDLDIAIRLFPEEYGTLERQPLQKQLDSGSNLLGQLVFQTKRHDYELFLPVDCNTSDLLSMCASADLLVGMTVDALRIGLALQHIST